MSSIRKQRHKLCITQKELAKMLGVSQSAVAKWEIGSSYPSTANLIKLVKLLDCSMNMLIIGKEE